MINSFNEKQRRECYIKKNYNELYDEIILFKTEKMEFDISNNFSQLLYHFNNNLISESKCKICNNVTKFKNFQKGYNIYCSKKCIMMDKELIENRNEKSRKTNLNRYGVDNPMKNENIVNKMIETNKKNHNNIFSSSTDLIKNKIKKTNLEKYGKDSYLKTDEFKYKKEISCLIKYGVDNYTKSEKIKLKIKKTNINKYGFEFPLQCDIIKNKIKETNLKKYDGHHMSQKSKNGLLCNHFKKISFSYYEKELNNNYILMDVNNDNLSINHIKCNKIFNINKQLFYLRKKNHIEICTECNKLIKSSSNKENQLQDFIKDNYNDEILLNDRHLGKELDIYLPNLKLAFEFNGLYWHNELNKPKNYHMEKTELCENNGIQLIHIYEDDWDYKQDIVKSMILNKLNKSIIRIYARKTDIIEITDNKLVKDFLDNNHIQGFVGSSIKIGLYYKNELVSLMTFGKKRVAMGQKNSNKNEYELLRFCNKLNTNVIGGASKLFKYFINNYEYDNILTYADRSYSNGNLYKQLGFNYNGKTNCNYYYIIDNIKHYRFNFRKDKLVKEGYDNSLTEHEIMLNRKIYRIYNSGNLIFRY